MNKSEALILRDLVGALSVGQIRVDSKGCTVIKLPASERGRFNNALTDMMEAVKK